MTNLNSKRSHAITFKIKPKVSTNTIKTVKKIKNLETLRITKTK
jgi:hypothetical protein